jgi:hypothetical protein
MRAHTRSAYISSSVSLLNIGASLHSPTHPPPNPPNPTLRFTTLNHRNSPFAIVLCIAVSLTGASRSNRLIGISARRLHCRMRRSLLDACCEGRRSGGWGGGEGKSRRAGVDGDFSPAEAEVTGDYLPQFRPGLILNVKCTSGAPTRKIVFPTFPSPYFFHFDLSCSITFSPISGSPKYCYYRRIGYRERRDFKSRLHY